MVSRYWPISVSAPVAKVHPGSLISFVAIYLPALAEAFPMKIFSFNSFIKSNHHFFPFSFRMFSN